MVLKHQRVSTRSQAWPDTRATIRYSDPTQPEKRSTLSLDGKVRDIGSNGMFLEIEERVPTDTNLDIEINFDPNSRISKLIVKAKGKVVHTKSDGVGIRFTDMDLSRFQKCIVEKMKQADREAKSVYTIGEA